MAVIHFINSKKQQTKGSLSAVLAYTTKKQKTAFENGYLLSGVNCSPLTAYQEFINTKLFYKKTKGRQYYHFVQSFPVDENIDPKTAHEIALKFAESFEGYEIIVATHTDRNHIHSHFVMNSVNMDTGKKFHINQRELENLMKVSDSIVSDYGFSVCQPSNNKRVKQSLSNGEYYAMNKNESWKLRLILDIESTMKNAVSKEHFIWLMEQEGYLVKWSDNRKNITYTTPEGKKCKDNKLLESKFLKEAMENEFRIRQTFIYGYKSAGQIANRNSFSNGENDRYNREKLERYDKSSVNADKDIGKYSVLSGSYDSRAELSAYGRFNRKNDGESDKGSQKRISMPDYDGEGLEQRDIKRISEGLGYDTKGYERSISTGWEFERSKLKASLTGNGQTGRSLQELIYDKPDTISGPDSAGNDITADKSIDVTYEENYFDLSM